MDLATVLGSGVVAAIVAWITPLGKFQAERLKDRRERRAKLISDSRHHISSLLRSDEPPTLFLEDYQYIAIRPFLDKKALIAIEAMDKPGNVSNSASHGVFKSSRLQVLTFELERLEKKWKLV